MTMSDINQGKLEHTLENQSWEQIEYLTRSTKRIQILRAIQSSASQKSELANELCIPKSTLLRTLKRMVEYGWVDQIEKNRYDITPVGDKILSTFDDFYHQINTLVGVSNLEQVLPSDVTDCPEFLSILRTEIDYTDFTEYLSTQESPYSPMQKFITGLRSAEIECLFLGISNPFYTESVCKRLSKGDPSQLILSQDVADTICQYNTKNGLCVHESVSVYVTEDRFRYGGYTTDDQVVIEGIGSSMATGVVVELSLNYDPVQEWTNKIISQLKSASQVRGTQLDRN